MLRKMCGCSVIIEKCENLRSICFVNRMWKGICTLIKQIQNSPIFTKACVMALVLCSNIHI
jgi:hypothetical protein